jgi:hypothetical protein
MKEWFDRFDVLIRSPPLGSNKCPHQPNLHFADEEDGDGVSGEPINPFVKHGANIERPLVPNNASK